MSWLFTAIIRVRRSVSFAMYGAKGGALQAAENLCSSIDTQCKQASEATANKASREREREKEKLTQGNCIELDIQFSLRAHESYCAIFCRLYSWPKQRHEPIAQYLCR